MLLLKANRPDDPQRLFRLLGNGRGQTVDRGDAAREKFDEEIPFLMGDPLAIDQQARRPADEEQGEEFLATEYGQSGGQTGGGTKAAECQEDFVFAEASLLKLVVQMASIA